MLHFKTTFVRIRPSLTFRQLSQQVQNKEREVFIEQLSGKHAGISVLTLNRPSAKNSLGKLTIQQFRECLETIDKKTQQGETRVLIVRSVVDRVFCAGADLKERKTMDQLETSTFVNSLRFTFTQLENVGVPTIAAIDGAALGGGLELALCCDIRVAGVASVLGLPETKLAIIPGAGGTQRLPRLIGESKAKELIFTGRRLKSEDAFVIGLVNHAVEDGYKRALELAKEILPQVALRMAKVAISRGGPLDIASGLSIEQLCYAQVIPTEDRLEGLKAFQEKRPPVYKGK